MLIGVVVTQAVFDSARSSRAEEGKDEVMPKVTGIEISIAGGIICTLDLRRLWALTKASLFLLDDEGDRDMWPDARRRTPLSREAVFLPPT